MVTYKTNTASILEIYNNLRECDHLFLPPLSKRVDLKKFAKKLHENAVIFEAWDNCLLVGFLSCYFNDTINKTAFISNISVLEEYSNKGIGALLIKKCIMYGSKKLYSEICLEVSKDNHTAIKLYKKYNFVSFKNGTKHTKMRHQITREKNE